MAPRSLRLLPFLLAPTLLFVGGAPRATGEGPAVDTRRFPKLAHLLLLPEEQALLKELKDDKDRREFQKIFWARRDPTPGTSANEFAVPSFNVISRNENTILLDMFLDIDRSIRHGSPVR